jgi:hypothetical protein
MLAYPIDHATTLEVVTLQRRLAAIREQHAAAGLELETSSSAFRDTWRGTKRSHGQPAVKKRPLIVIQTAIWTPISVLRP